MPTVPQNPVFLTAIAQRSAKFNRLFQSSFRVLRRGITRKSFTVYDGIANLSQVSVTTKLNVLAIK